jgi:hypothetical protein
MEQTVEFDGFIGIFENYFDPGYIDGVIEYFEANKGLPLVQQSPNAKHDRDHKEMFFSDPKSIQVVPKYFTEYFFQTIWEKIIPLYQEEFSILGTTQLAGEELKLKKIKPGGGFHSWHYEGQGEYSKRKLVVQLYMNDISNAGETEFLYQNKRIAPKKNRLIVWPSDWTHTHRGNPPIGVGDKYILNTWLFEAPKG